ncbi:hypothetical protein HBH98_172850 [Parastagonospora nodorum]|uniref:Uncharacterized protein n=1 Tax=Phaeosphaeria nodorum (strain SN15 / ATCC MYA-4574 / FGSC 10173) TaxID=321614 RepID=A0A7U2FBH6_PHANO|nr:hypothetical protein HBH54_061550 [Parastagonospora nodorum]QRC99905.1 hypothetical protein JI435_414250 [Parastagonospora nodorum SN15]KAH4001766.1 hypothetical protein HBI10_078520 [Parastagonospora nodorum]KAH4039559.1 hypothetical protein HBI09_033580 [Parastagonospora nodorum]KAH4075573.1 hypothetical protein HBH50_018540 [Parastagonospora nodorum]
MGILGGCGGCKLVDIKPQWVSSTPNTRRPRNIGFLFVRCCRSPSSLLYLATRKPCRGWLRGAPSF